MRKLFRFVVLSLALRFVPGITQGAHFVVGLDTYHSNATPAHSTWDATGPGGFSEFKTLIESIGASTATVDSELTSTALADLDVLIIVDPGTASEAASPNDISAAEMSVITAWVNSGGVLFLMGNNAGHAEFESFNLLAGEFGIRFNADTASGGPVYGPLPVTRYFLGAESLHIVGASTLSLTAPAQSLLDFNSETFMALAGVGSGKVLAIGAPWIDNEGINHEDNKAALTTLCGVLFAGHDGVPTITITDYAQNVESWWSEHVFNSDSPAYQPLINSPAPIIDVAAVHAGNPTSTTAGIQEALDMLPATGGTLWLPKSHGEYVITEPFHEEVDLYPFGGSILILRKGNIHLVSNGATLKSDHTLFGISGMEWRDHPGKFTMDPSRASGFYFKGLTFDGNNQARFGAMTWRHVDDAVVEDCVFQRFYQLADPENHDVEMGARTIFSANTMSDNLWWRRCEFKDHTMKRCVFIDGCHGGGVLNSIIQGNENGGGITFPTNDDVTRDLNQDGIAQKSEQRTSQYIVIAGNQFSRIASSSFALALGAANSLVLKNTLEGHVGRFVSLGNRCHLVNAFGMDWYYELYDNVFVGNQIESCDVFYSMDIVGPLLDHPPARAGRNSIRCNRITNAPSAFRWMVINKPEQLEAPNEITGNCVNDPECVASGCELRSSGTVDFSLDEVGDLAEVGAKPGSGPQPEGQREPGRGL